MQIKRTSIWKTFNRHGRASMFGVFLILVVITAILLYLRNEYHQKQIHQSYCGDLGFYGKSLTLMKDNSFRFSYHGCSQAIGYVSGKWMTEGDIITLLPDQADVLPDTQYKQIKNQLLPMNLTSVEGFVFCNDYIAPWQR